MQRYSITSITGNRVKISLMFFLMCFHICLHPDIFHQVNRPQPRKHIRCVEAFDFCFFSCFRDARSILHGFSERFPRCLAVAVALTVRLCGWPCCSGGSGLLFPSVLSLPLTASHLRSAEALAPSPCQCRGSTSPGTNTYDMERPRSDRMQHTRST